MNNNSPFNIRVALNDLIKLLRLRTLLKNQHKFGSFYLCNQHLGDTVIFCSIAKSLQKIENKKFTIIVEERYRYIPAIFGLNFMTADIPKIRIPFVESLNFFFLLIFNFFSKRKLLLSFPVIFLYIKCPRKTLYSNMYDRYKISIGAKSEIPFSCIDDAFKSPPADIEEDFIRYNLRIRRTVIISPDSLSMKTIDINFFITLYQLLEKMDYVPIINSDNKFWAENGYKAFFPEIVILLYFSLLAGYSISARSGVSDLLSFTPNVKNIVIYGEFVSGDFIIGKEKGKLCSNIEEYFYTAENEKNLIRNIILSLEQKSSD